MEKKKLSRNQMNFGHPKLPKWEQMCYWCVILTALTYPFYVTYELSTKYKAELSSDFFITEWFSLEKDITDTEWIFWWNYSFQLGIMFTTYAFAGLCFIHYLPSLQQSYFIIASFVMLCFAFSTQVVLLISIHLIIFYLFLLLESETLMWVMSLTMIYAVNNENMFAWQISLFKIDDQQSTITQISLLLCYLRGLSYGSEVLGNREKIGLNIQHYMHYATYLPLFFNGPVLTYDIFASNVINPQKIDFQEIMMDLLGCIFYACSINLSFHFIYVPALSAHYHILENLCPMEALSIAWVQVVLFYVKYYVFYRFTGLFAKLNGFKPPGPPKCIASLYTFVDMWRYFDCGLYRFLQRCIYIPLGGSKCGFPRQTLASILCFAFVGFWHDFSYTSMYWGLTNWCGIFIEAILLAIVCRFDIRKKLGGILFRYSCALGGAFSIFALIYANNVYLIGVEASNILVFNILSSKVAFIKTICVLYTSVHCSIEVN